MKQSKKSLLSLQYNIETNGNGMKVKDYLIQVLEYSARFTKNAASENRIKVNGKNVLQNDILKLGDLVEVVLQKEENQNIQPENISIDVIFEDDDIIVVNKPPFMLVHPTPNHPMGTLASAVLFHFQQNNENCIVRLVSRLDRDTSGLIIIAKNSFAHMNLAKSMEKNEIVKTYIAVVHGHIDPLEGTINKPIGKSEDDPIKRIVREDGQISITHYRTIKKLKNDSLVELILETGRTHQIRVHLSSVEHPIFGDPLYGNAEDKGINRQALHASKLSFPHPRTGVILTLASELPMDIANLVERLGNSD